MLTGAINTVIGGAYISIIAINGCSRNADTGRLIAGFDTIAGIVIIAFAGMLTTSFHTCVSGASIAITAVYRSVCADAKGIGWQRNAQINSTEVMVITFWSVVAGSMISAVIISAGIVVIAFWNGFAKLKRSGQAAA